MEGYQNENENQNELFSLTIDPLVKSHLVDTAKWARFLAIAGIILLSLGVLFTILNVTVLKNSGLTRYTYNGVEQEELTAGLKATVFILMLIIFAIAFFPMWYLLQFANKMKIALYSNDQEALISSFLNIKRYFRYVGAITIIVLVFYGLAILFILLGAAMS
ncbi:MAG TPA: hypothetical protein VNT20_05585 [Flavisolibacter sp.]|jgi:hypothetical protein|nr:hypothetical protein [Flavisolibacter sp.]